MAGKCKKRTVTFGRWVGRQLKPSGIRLVAKLVGIAETSGLSGKAKRDLVIAAAKASLEEAKEGAIRAAIQLAHFQLEAAGVDALEELGDADDADLEDDETP